MIASHFLVRVGAGADIEFLITLNTSRMEHVGDEEMKFDLATQTRNTVTVMLMQAMWGVISPNFRRIAWTLLDHAWTVQFGLERDDAEDREEIEDAMSDFDALLLEIEGGPGALLSEVIVSAEPLSMLDLNVWRPVYIRREKLTDPKT